MADPLPPEPDAAVFRRFWKPQCPPDVAKPWPYCGGYPDWCTECNGGVHAAVCECVTCHPGPLEDRL
jgi:hypothetical protein